MLAVGAERHRPLSGEPRCEFLVRLDQPVRPHAHQDGSQPVQDVVGPIRLRRDLRVEADQRLPHVVLDEDLVRLPSQVLWPKVVPTAAGEHAVPPREAGSDGRMVGDGAAKNVTDERLDRVRLGEGHAGNLIGVPLRRAGPVAGFGHEQRRVRFAGEHLDLIAVTTEAPFDLAGRRVAERQPDDLRRRTVQREQR